MEMVKTLGRVKNILGLGLEAHNVGLQNVFTSQLKSQNTEYSQQKVKGRESKVSVDLTSSNPTLTS